MKKVTRHGIPLWKQLRSLPTGFLRLHFISPSYCSLLLLLHCFRYGLLLVSLTLLPCAELQVPTQDVVCDCCNPVATLLQPCCNPVAPPGVRNYESFGTSLLITSPCTLGPPRGKSIVLFSSKTRSREWVQQLMRSA